MTIKLPNAYNFEFLSLNGGCRGSSETTHVKITYCWKSHVKSKVLLFQVLAVYKNNTIDTMGIRTIGATSDNTDASKLTGTGYPNTGTTTAGRTSDC